MSKKQWTYGQYETPADVADLLLGFCLRRPEDRLLDPSCGAGAFLVRAAQLKLWLDPETSPQDSLWGVELDAEAARQAREALPQARIIERNFFELEPGLSRPYDAIVGNPPYTRARLFASPVEIEPPARQLAIFEDQDQKRWTPSQIGADLLSRRSGLHAYFLVHGTQFLREGGRFGFVIPNSLLDVAYGERLKRFLLDHYRILTILESSVERWFGQAKVNTCLLVLEKCSDANARAANRVRFGRLRQPLRKLIHFDESDYRRLSHLERLTARLLPSDDVDDDDLTAHVIYQRELTSEEKWGIVLRAPAFYRRRVPDFGMHPLKHWATVRRGFTTGANSFFYLDATGIQRWNIEPEYLQPLCKSLRHVHKRRVGSTDCRQQVLLISPEQDLASSAASAYVAWGEAQGLHRRSTCAGRRPWYSLPEQGYAPLILAKGVWTRHFTPVIEEAISIDQQLYQIQLAKGVSPMIAASLLNSSWFALQLELHGRLNFGEGVLWLAGYELGEVLMPDPRYLPDGQLAGLADLFAELVDEPISAIQDELSRPAWQALNEAVFRLLGLSTAQGRAVDRALAERVEARQSKAQTVAYL